MDSASPSLAMIVVSQLSFTGGNFLIHSLTQCFWRGGPGPETGYMKAQHCLLLESGMGVAKKEEDPRV